MRRVWLVFWSPGERRLRAGLRLALQAAATIAFTLPLQLALSALLQARMGLGSAEEVDRALFDEGRSAWGLAAFGVAGLAGSVTSVLLCTRFLDRRPIACLGLRFDRLARRDLAFGLALGALLALAVFLVELRAGWIRTVESHTSVLDASFASRAVPFALLFACVGVSEELASRGYQLRNLAEGLRIGRLGPDGAGTAAVVLTSIFFGLAHLGNPHVTALAALAETTAGLMYGAAFLLTGGLALPIGLHATWNFFQGPVFGFPVSGIAGARAGAAITILQEGPDVWTGGAYGPDGGLIGVLRSALGIGLVLLWAKRTRGALRPIGRRAGPDATPGPS